MELENHGEMMGKGDEIPKRKGKKRLLRDDLKEFLRETCRFFHQTLVSSSKLSLQSILGTHFWTRSFRCGNVVHMNYNYCSC